MTRAPELQPSDGVDDLIGQLIGDRFRIEYLLGEGDRKKTYVAVDTKFRGRRVALSVVRPDAIEQDGVGTQREADILTSLGPHDYIVGFHDASVEGQLHYIVFEYLRGGTLADLVMREQARGEFLQRGQILKLSRQLTRALSHIHRRGVIHRDVSPHNVWLDERAEAHLGDFDSAIFADSQTEARPITTRRFASPEDLDGKRLDPRSDLYSLGRVIAFLATAEIGTERCCVHTRTTRPDLPHSLHDLVARLMAERPEDRPQDADAVLRELKEAELRRDLQSIIAGGEGETVEFKSTLCSVEVSPDVPPAVRAQKVKELRQKVEKSALRAIVAFLNSRGGTLLIGVADSGRVVGVEQDFSLVGKRKHDADEWQLYFKDRVIEGLGPDAWSCIALSLEAVDEHTVARVECAARAVATWLRTADNQYEFFVRVGNASEALSGPAQLRYILETGRARSKDA